MRLREAMVRGREWGWMVPPVTAGTVVMLIGVWTGRLAVPDVAGEMQRGIEAQIITEDARVCEHLGFAAGTPLHATCLADLLGVRRSDRELQGAIGF
ncbi:MAG: hypothetical protein ACREF3_01920 [Acetobacteraceae bacterium]